MLQCIGPRPLGGRILLVAARVPQRLFLSLTDLAFTVPTFLLMCGELGLHRFGVLAGAINFLMSPILDSPRMPRKGLAFRGCFVHLSGQPFR